MPTSTRKCTYGTPVTGSGGITSLGSSSDWTANYEWYIIDNSTDRASHRHQTGKIQVGTSPTANTEIRIYLVVAADGTTWPDVFDGTPSAETFTSEGVRDSFAKLAAVLRVNATTSNRDYPFDFEVRSVLGFMPKKCAVVIAHNTGANLNGTAGNHTYSDQPISDTMES